MSKRKPSYLKCEQHGKKITAVVCCHMIDAVDPVGFVENSSDPKDLQAWCEECEQFFVAEKGMTEAFVAFNEFAVVCCDCYNDIKEQHSRGVKAEQKVLGEKSNNGSGNGDVNDCRPRHMRDSAGQLKNDGEQSVGRGAANRVNPEGNVDWRRPGQRGRYPIETLHERQKE